MSRLMRSWPFTFLGLFTIVLFLVAEALDRGGREIPHVEALHGLLRVIIIPIWLMRYAVVAVGGMLFGFSEGKGFPIWYEILTVPILLLPYIALDLILMRAWPRSGNTDLP